MTLLECMIALLIMGILLLAGLFEAERLSLANQAQQRYLQAKLLGISVQQAQSVAAPMDKIRSFATTVLPKGQIFIQNKTVRVCWQAEKRVCENV